jgi:hypothetical protein
VVLRSAADIDRPRTFPFDVLHEIKRRAEADDRSVAS